MIPLESQLCPLRLSKQIVELGGNTDSWFKWVYITPEKSIEKKALYILRERYKTQGRITCPAYTLEEILRLLPEDSILGRIETKWYCKAFSSDSWSDIKYYNSATEACAHAYIRVLKEAKKE